MNVLLSISIIVLLLFPFILIIGLIKPKVILKWSKKPTRLKVVGWWFLALLLYFVASVSLYHLSESMKTPAEMISSSEKEIANGWYDTAIRRLQRIAPEDSLYTHAQELIGRADSLSKEDELKSEEKIKFHLIAGS